MPFGDLREYLAKLRELNELATVRKEVDPKYEVGAVCKAAHDRGRKALYFERVRGASMPVVTELLTTLKRLSIALESDETDLFLECVKRTEKLIPPKIVDYGPCQEIVQSGSDVDLNHLPWITWNRTEVAPYLTAGLVIVKDPEFGRNLGVYRMMYANRSQTFLRFRPGHHGYEFYKRAELRGEKKLDVAVVLGTDPAVFLGSQFVAGIGVDEFAIAGALRGAAVELVHCKTVDLEVPATAEIVLEGSISIPPEIGDEGPYGEFCGYSVGTVVRERLWTVHCVTMRKNPVYHGFYLCKGANEEGVIKSLTTSVQIYRELKPQHPAIKRVYCTPPGVGSFHCLIQISEREKRPGMVNNLLAAVAGVKAGGVKHVFVFDDDVDITSPEEVEWAFATRVQADKDIFIIPNCAGIRLDPSADSEGVTAKLFVDATKSKNFRAEGLALPPDEVLRNVKANWDSYFLA